MQGFSCLVFLLLLKTMSYLDAGFKADAAAASTVIKIAQVPLKGVFIITPWYLFINTNQTMLCCKYITHYFNWKLTYNINLLYRWHILKGESCKEKFVFSVQSITKQIIIQIAICSICWVANLLINMISFPSQLKSGQKICHQFMANDDVGTINRLHIWTKIFLESYSNFYLHAI